MNEDTKSIHRVAFPKPLATRLSAEAARRGLTLETLVPVIVEEYFRMWDDLDQGAAILKGPG